MRDSFAKDPLASSSATTTGLRGWRVLLSSGSSTCGGVSESWQVDEELADECGFHTSGCAGDSHPALPDILNLRNGLLDIWTKELHAHSPSFAPPFGSRWIFVRISPAHESKVPPGGLPYLCLRTPWEILAISSPRPLHPEGDLPGRRRRKAKESSPSWQPASLGRRIHPLSLQRLENDRFAVARLQGKLANTVRICRERLNDSSIFKAITGCDRITGEVKYRIRSNSPPFGGCSQPISYPPAANASSAYLTAG